MHRYRRVVAVAALVAVLGSSTAGTVAAGDPASGGTGINIQAGGPRTSTELGYSDEYATQKAQAFQARSATGVSPEYAVVMDGLLGFVVYHQKTTYNYLPATAQSFLQWEFGGYISPSVAAKQGTATQASGTITKGMRTTTGGTDDYQAFAWVNGQYAAHGSSWRYIPVNDTLESNFEDRIGSEISVLAHMLYVRVDLTSTSFPWHQSKEAQHATGAIGYVNYGANTNIADPWPSTNGGTCVVQPGGAPPPYSSTPDKACYWSAWSTDKYFLSKDVVRLGEVPEFY